MKKCENVFESPVHQGGDKRNGESVYLEPGEKDEIKVAQAESSLEVSVTEKRMGLERETFLM